LRGGTSGDLDERAGEEGGEAGEGLPREEMGGDARAEGLGDYLRRGRWGVSGGMREGGQGRRGAVDEEKRGG
jgi:hypothetical protein